MEFPHRFVRGERLLALLLLVPVLAAAWLERSSPVAAASRRREPWTCWLALKPETAAQPQLFLALYRPGARALDLIHIPSKAHKNAHPAEGAEAGRLQAEEASALFSAEGPEELGLALEPQRFHYEATGAWTDEPPLEAKRIIRTIWRNGEGLGAFERIRLRAELLGLEDTAIRAAFLPESKEERLSYFRRLFGSPATEPQTEQPVVEILNCTGEKGIASRLTKVLRSRGADVMSTGNAPFRTRSLVIDRTGRPELAARVRGMLGCRNAETVTQIDAKRLVDASVVVAADCAQTE